MSTQKRHTLIAFENVDLLFHNGPHLFHQMNLSVPEKSFHFLTGASGAGKSTLLKLMYLDLPPSGGKIKIFNKDTEKLAHNKAAMMRRKIGVVFQDFRLINHLTALENVALPLKVEGVDYQKREKEAVELLEWVGLQDHLHVPPPQLSGGQQQRVAIARAIVNRPRILLADEPTGNVDDQIAMRLLYLFEELNRNGTTVIVATHNQVLADAFPYPEIMIENRQAILKEKQKKKTEKDKP